MEIPVETVGANFEESDASELDPADGKADISEEEEEEEEEEDSTETESSELENHPGEPKDESDSQSERSLLSEEQASEEFEQLRKKLEASEEKKRKEAEMAQAAAEKEAQPSFADAFISWYQHKQTRKAGAEKAAAAAAAAALLKEEKRIADLIEELGPTTGDRRLVRQLMAIYSPAFNTYLKMTMPIRLFAKLSKVDFLDVAMQEHTEEIDIWDGTGNIPKCRNLKRDFQDAFRGFYDQELKQNALDIAGLTEEDDPVPKLPSAQTALEWVRYGRTAYNEIRHCMPKGVQKAAVHKVVLKELSKCQGKPSFEKQLEFVRRELHKKKFPELWPAPPVRPKRTATKKKDDEEKAAEEQPAPTKTEGKAATLNRKRKTAAAAAAEAASKKSGRSGLRKRKGVKASTLLPSVTFASPAKRRASKGRTTKKKAPTKKPVDEMAPPAKRTGVGSKVVYEEPSVQWQRERLARSNQQQQFINYLYLEGDIPEDEIEYDGFGAVVPRPNGTSVKQWELIAQAHTRLVALGTQTIELESTFFQGAGPSKGLEAVSLNKVTHHKWRTSVGTWIPRGMKFGAQAAGFGILLTQQKVADGVDQHAYYRDLIMEKFTKKDAKDLLTDSAAILRCYSLFAQADNTIAQHTMPKLTLDAGVVLFEQALKNLEEEA